MNSSPAASPARCRQSYSTLNYFQQSFNKQHMDFKSWLSQTKIDEPDLEVFITKLEPFFTDAGFNGLEFEKKINIGLRKFENDIDELLKPGTNVENQ